MTSPVSAAKFPGTAFSGTVFPAMPFPATLLPGRLPGAARLSSLAGYGTRRRYGVSDRRWEGSLARSKQTDGAEVWQVLRAPAGRRDGEPFAALEIAGQVEQLIVS